MPFFAVLNRVAALTLCVLLPVNTLPASARSFADPTNSFSRHDEKPRLRFVAPTFNASTGGSQVTVKLAMSRREDASTLEVLLNGHDISDRLHSTSCRAMDCDVEGAVRLQDGLRDGRNQLTAAVKGIGRERGDVRHTLFGYHLSPGLVGSNNTIENYEPASLGIKTLNPGGASPWIQITSGNTMNVNDPVASFPALTGAQNIVSVPYPDVQFGTNCTTALQAIVLARSTPSVEEATGCGNNVSDLTSSIQTNLKAGVNHELGASDLVILGTTSGNQAPAGLDTTSFGGTKYSGSSSPVPQGYMLIGVLGALSGTAWESYYVATGPTTPYQYAPLLNGTLVLDNHLNYNYVPSDERSLLVTSAGSSTTANLAGQFYGPPSSSASGYFWLLVFDRELLQPINLPDPVSQTGVTQAACPYDGAWGSTPTECGIAFDPRQDGGASLAATLNSIDSRDLIVLATQGCPFDNTTQVSSALADAVQNLGGVQHTLLSLNSTANTCAYSLVTSQPPPNSPQQGPLSRGVALSANQFASQGQNGVVNANLARETSGLFNIANKDQGTFADNTGAAGSIDYTFEQTASSQRTDWPLTDTPGHLAAYHDISQQLLTDPNIAKDGSYLYDVRSFYTNVETAYSITQLIDSRLSDKATNPVVQSSYDQALPQEFNDAKTQLITELQQLKNSIDYLTSSSDNGGVRGILDGPEANIFGDAFGVAGAIGGDQDKAAQQNVNANGSDILNLSAGIFSILGPIAGAAAPEVGVLFGVMSGAFWTGSAALTPLSGSLPGPQSSYDVLLNSVINDANTYTLNALAGFDAAVDNIFSDPAKLATVGELTENTGGTWQLKNLGSYDTISDFVQDGARRSLWIGVLGGIYGIRQKQSADFSDPATFGSNVTAGRSKQYCASVYSANNSGVVPTQSMFTSPNIGDVTKWDTYFMAEGVNPSQPDYSNDVEDFAISSDLGTLLTTTQQVTLGGATQTGLNTPPMILYTSSPLHYGNPLYFNGYAGQTCDAKVVGQN
jgi:hypothetical protein